MILLLALAVAALAAALFTYPGEWSYLGPRANRLLYNHGAATYQDKWLSRGYTDARFVDPIRHNVASGLAAAGSRDVLDLGCGTGRGVRLLADSLPADTRFTCIDFSPGMLQQLRNWLETRDTLGQYVNILEQELGEWAQGDGAERYGAVLMLEAGEFVPAFRQVIDRIGRVTLPGAALVLTRPAGLWSLCFPGRCQSRRALRQRLLAAGFGEIHFLPWRSRYELVFARRREPAGGQPHKQGITGPA